MDLKLTGKVAPLPDRPQGSGSRSLASEGAHVYVNGRTQERVDPLRTRSILYGVSRNRVAKTWKS